MRTINRQPYSVKQLSYGDIKYKFFNHSNWKGVCDDKNYLSIDQETFADSNNVYVDGEGVLRSRPSLKQYAGEYTDVQTYGEYIVYERVADAAIRRRLSISKNGVTLQFTDGTSLITVSNNYKIVVASQKMYIFEKDKISYIDLIPRDDGKYYYYSDVKTPIYVPVTEVITGITKTKNESKNVLTTSEIHRYLYDSQAGNFVLGELAGKNAEVKFGTTKEYDFPGGMVEGSVKTITEKVGTLPKASYINGNPMFWGNDTGITMYAVDANSGYNLYYSIDGRVYNQLPFLEGVVGYPTLSTSTDHVFAVLFKADGAYAYTLGGAAIEKGTRTAYSTWTKIAEFNTDTGTLGGFAQGDFLDEKTFAILNGTNLYTARDGKITKHTSVGGTFADTIVSCSPYVTVVLNRSSYKVFYNDADVQINSFFNLNAGVVTSAPTSLTRSCVKIRAYKYTVTLAAIQGTTFFTNAETDAKVKVYTTVLTENNVLNHTTDLDSSQKNVRELKFVRSVGSPLGNLSNDDYRLIMSPSQTIYTNYFTFIGSECISNADYQGTQRPLAFAGETYYAYSTTYGTGPNDVYSNNLSQVAYIDYTVPGKLTFDVFDYEAELSNYFVSKGQNLYISAQGQNVEPGDFKWYFPERNVQTFDYEITNLHPISTTEIAVFLKNSIYYVKPTAVTINGIETVAYSYYKSRIPLGCNKGSDVITSYDNKYTMFVTKRGFVAMSYQDFIASEEQALTFLSDEIFDLFNEWNIGGIKLCQYNFWIILYRPGIAKAFIFDMRSNSWWPVEYNSNGKKLIELEDTRLVNNEVVLRKELYLLNGYNDYLYYFDKGNDKYYDGNKPETGRINWHLTSQKLHLDAINYYKHIINLTFYGYNYDNKELLTKFNLRVINYRKQTDTNEIKSFESVEYKIELTRTFVKRINYYKVNQVQYILESCRDIDQEDAVPTPLCLTAISLKYLVTGQVR